MWMSGLIPPGHADQLAPADGHPGPDRRLADQPGGHLGAPRRPRLLSVTEPGWATSSYEPGGALIFHCLTPHAALPNHGY